MAIVAFHFSGVYKDKLLSGKKTASVMPGAHVYEIGSHVLVYLSDTPNLFDKGAKETRIGEATIMTCRQCKLKDLTKEEAINCGYETAELLKKEMKQWFPHINDKSPVTCVRFKTDFRKV
jgi:hypothetical protein